MLSHFEFKNWRYIIAGSEIAKFSVSYQSIQEEPSFKEVSLNIYVDDAVRLSLALQDEEMVSSLEKHLKRYGYPPLSEIQKKIRVYWINISHLAYLQQFLNDLCLMDSAIDEVINDIVYLASKHIKNKTPIEGWIKEGDFRWREMNWPKPITEAYGTPLVRAAYYMNADPNGKFKRIDLLGYRDGEVRLWAELNGEYEKETMASFKKFGLLKIKEIVIKDEQTLENYLKLFNREDSNVSHLMKDITSEYRNRNKMNSPLPFTIFCPIKGGAQAKVQERKLRI